MIRPIDIQEKEFSRSFRGFKEEEVNRFLDEITIDLERLLNELREIRAENSRLVEELERLRGAEGAVSETLHAAKTLMNNMAASAEKQADILVKNAESDVALMLKNAREEAGIITKQTEEMKKRYIQFRNRYKVMLETELERFVSGSGDELPELGVIDFNDLPLGEDDMPMAPMTTDTIQKKKF